MSGDIDGELVEAGRVELSTGDRARGSQQIRRAESHFAGSQLGFRSTRQARGSWKCMDRSERRRGEERLAEAGAQQRNDLLNLDNLLCRRENKRGEAFPWVLAQKAQSA